MEGSLVSTLIVLFTDFRLNFVQLKEQLAVEKQAWEENYMKKQETYLMQKERETQGASEEGPRQGDRDGDREDSRRTPQATEDECERVAENRIKYDLVLIA